MGECALGRWEWECGGMCLEQRVFRHESFRVHGLSQDSSQVRSIFPWRKKSPGQPGWTPPFWSPQAAHTWGVPRLLPHPLPRLLGPCPSPTRGPPTHVGCAESRQQCPGLADLAGEGLQPAPTLPPSSPPSSCRSPSKPTIWQSAAPVPPPASLVQQARLKLPQKL